MASNLNFTAGEIIPNLVVVPVGPDGKIDFYNYADSINLAADLAGYYVGGWGTAIEVPGTAALNTGGNGGVASVSCASAGNCAVGGHYTDSATHSQAFVVSEVNDAWGTAIEVPGTAALNVGGSADVYSLSCASAGNCTAGGFYKDSINYVTYDYHYQAFVVSEH